MPTWLLFKFTYSINAFVMFQVRHICSRMIVQVVRAMRHVCWVGEVHESISGKYNLSFQ